MSYWSRLILVAVLAVATALVVIGLWALVYTASIQAPASPSSSVVVPA